MDSKVLTFSGPFRAEDGSSVARKVTFQLGRKGTLLLGANTRLLFRLSYGVNQERLASQP
jgi:hypothetical protein